MRVEKDKPRKDGSFLRKYVCNWSCCGQRELDLAGRDKCSQGKIIAEEFENYVWDRLSFSLTGSHPDSEKEKELQKKAEDQFDFLSGGNIEEQITDIEGEIDRFKIEYRKKKRANKRILDLLEDEEIDLKSLRSRLQENEQEIIILNEKIGNLENDHLELQQILTDKSSYLESKDMLYSIWSDLQDFTPEDKKRLIESLVPDGITVMVKRNPNRGGGHRLGTENVLMNIEWNPLIFKHFEEQGKFSSLDSDGRYQL